jgi:hypothetical protein
MLSSRFAAMLRGRGELDGAVREATFGSLSNGQDLLDYRQNDATSR